MLGNQDTGTSYFSDDEDSPSRQLGSLVAKASPASLVGMTAPPPDSPPAHEVGRSTPLTGSLAAAPSQAQPKNRDTGTGYSGISNPPDGGNVRSVVSPTQQPSLQPAGPAPLMPAGVGGLQPAMPSLPAASPQQVAPDRLNMQTQQDQQRLSQLQSAPTGGRQINNRWGRIGAQILDTAGSIVAPGVAQYIPGASLNQQRLIGKQQQIVGSDQAQQVQRAQLEDIANQAQERQAKAGMEGGANATKLGVQGLRNQGNLAVVTQKDVDAAPMRGEKAIDDPENPGQKMIVADEDSPVYQLKGAQAALDSAKAELARAGNDVNSPAYKLALQKAKTASSNAAAANIRAVAYMGNYKMHSQGVGLDDQPLNGIPTIGGAPMGTSVSPQAIKAAGNIAKFNDVRNSIDNANAALDEGDKVGAKYNTAAMTAALSDPKTTSAQWLTGKVNTTLNPQEQNMVITTKALREQLNAMRSSVGGGVSDSQVDRLVDQLPNATTPDMGYARKQLATVRRQLDELQTGLPQVNNGPTLRPAGGPARPTAPGGVPKSIPKTHPAGAEVWVRGKDGNLVKQ